MYQPQSGLKQQLSTRWHIFSAYAPKPVKTHGHFISPNIGSDFQFTMKTF